MIATNNDRILIIAPTITLIGKYQNFTVVTPFGTMTPRKL